MTQHRNAFRAAAALAVILLAHAAPAQIDWPDKPQLAETPTADSLIAPGQPDRREHLVRIGLAWLLPANEHHRAWKRLIDARADEPTPDREPRDIHEAARIASIAKATAMRWCIDPVGPFSKADLSKVTTALSHMQLTGDEAFGGSPSQRAAVLLDLLVAYDLVRSAQIDNQHHRNITQRLRQAATRDIAIAPGMQVNHLRAQIAATQALAALILHDAKLLTAATTELRTSLQSNTTDDGWYTDGQSTPLNRAIAPLAYLLAACRSATGDDLFKHVAPLVDMTLAMQLPDARLPNLQGGLHAVSAIPLFARSADESRRAAIQRYLLAAIKPDDTAGIDPVDLFLLTDFSQKPSAHHDALTYFSPGEAKLTVMRQGWTPESDWLMLSPGVDGRAVEGIRPGGNHFDTGELLLAAHGEYLLTAPGTTSDAAADEELRRATSHNVLLVDGGVGPRGDVLRGHEVTHTHRLRSADRACDFASLLMRYGDTQVRRSVAYIDSRYFIIADTMQSSAPHDYAFNLVGRGIFAPLDAAPRRVSVAWAGKHGQVIATLVATHDLRIEADQVHVHLDADKPTRADRLRATARAAGGDDGGISGGAWLGVLETNRTDRRRQLTVTDVSTDRIAAITVQDALHRWTDTIISQIKRKPIVIAEVNTDALFAYVRRTHKGDVTAAAIIEGTMLSAENLAIKLDRPATLVINWHGNRVTGHVAADGFPQQGITLSISGLRTIVTATHNGQPITLQQGNLILREPGDFELRFVGSR